MSHRIQSLPPDNTSYTTIENDPNRSPHLVPCPFDRFGFEVNALYVVVFCCTYAQHPIRAGNPTRRQCRPVQGPQIPHTDQGRMSGLCTARYPTCANVFTCTFTLEVCYISMLNHLQQGYQGTSHLSEIRRVSKKPFVTE